MLNIRSLLSLAIAGTFLLAFSAFANAQNPFQSANHKLTQFTQPQAMDDRARFISLFCQNLKLNGAALGYKKKCSAYINDSQINSQFGKPLNIANPLINGGVNLRVAMVGGIFSDCIKDKVDMFANAKSYIRNSNIPSINSINFSNIRITGYSTSKINAQLIAAAIGKMNIAKDERLIVISYSKGTADMIEALATFPKLAKKIDAHLSIAGVVLGSPLANNKEIFSKIFNVLKLNCKGPDGEGIQSITTNHREQFLKNHVLPKNVKYYSLIGNASKARTSIGLRPLRAQLVRSGIKHSDAQVPAINAVMPSSKVLAFMNADHWAIAMPFDTSHPILANTIINRNTFPREIMLSSAIQLIAQDLTKN